MPIFKIQTPLVTNEPVLRAMIYNEGRSWQGLVPVTPEITSLMGDSPKIYVEGFIGIDDKLNVTGLAEDQDW